MELIELRGHAKRLRREAERAGREKASAVAQARVAIEDRKLNVARLHAENAKRNEVMQMEYLVLASELDAMGPLIQNALFQKDLSRSMSKLTTGLSAITHSTDVKRIHETLTAFKRSIGVLEVSALAVSGTINEVTHSHSRADDVSAMLAEIANDADLNAQLASLVLPVGVARVVEADIDDLQARMDALNE